MNVNSRRYSLHPWSLANAIRMVTVIAIFFCSRTHSSDDGRQHAEEVKVPTKLGAGACVGASFARSNKYEDDRWHKYGL